MKVTELPLSGLKLIEMPVFKDDRGFFTERYQADKMREAGVPNIFVQDNLSRSKPGVIRGMHFQHSPHQGKLVGVIRGKILDVVVDLRAGSPTFGKNFSIELTDDSGQLLWVPGGFAHGFCVIGTEITDVLYKVDCSYRPDFEWGIRWSDPEMDIKWPVATPSLSARDQALPSYAEFKKRFPEGLK